MSRVAKARSSGPSWATSRPRSSGPATPTSTCSSSRPAQPGDEFADVANARSEEARDARRRRVRGRSSTGRRSGSVATSKASRAVVGGNRAARGGGDRAAPGPALRRPTIRCAPRASRQLADRFVADLTQRPCGMIKIGAGYHALKPFEEKAFEAAAAAHARVGAPVCVHTEHGTMGLGLVERLDALGVPPAQGRPGAPRPEPRRRREHAETAATGAWLQLDGPGRTKYWPDSTILALIADLAERGHADRLLLGGDTGRRSMHARIRRRAGPRLPLRPLQAAARARARRGALATQIFVAEPGARVRVRPRAAKRRDVPAACPSAHLVDASPFVPCPWAGGGWWVGACPTDCRRATRTGARLRPCSGASRTPPSARSARGRSPARR